MIRISAVVCTFNRSKVLVGALNSLSAQSLSSSDYEIIVVNNASTDDTEKVVRRFRKDHPHIHIQSVFERRPGLGCARNAGLCCSRGDFVAYLDDDAVAHPQWLKRALECFQAISPSPVCVGGPILPFFEVSKPPWFKDEYETRTWGKVPRYLTWGEKFSGSNMIFRKSFLRGCKGFNETLGMTSKFLSVGEETDLFERLWRNGNGDRLFYYCPRLIVHHKVFSHRMTPVYRLKRAYAEGQSWQRRQINESAFRRWVSIIRAIGNVVFWSGSALTRRWCYHHIENWLVEAWWDPVHHIGRLSEGLRLNLYSSSREARDV